ncbi:MAG TPA: hypothetical protein VFQ65_28610 [Kofleriaceae bacterium]|nr:hypothetical protein [Kofleriaceae bacterium]
MKAVIAIVIVAAARVAHASCNICDFGRDLQGGAYLHEELTLVSHVADPEPFMRGGVAAPRTIDQLGLAGFRLHGFAGKGANIGYHIGLDLGMGATLGRHGGFAYEVGFLPVGVAVRFGQSSWLTLGTGIVASGATGAVDDAAVLPLDVDLELDANRVRVIAWGRAGWAAGSPQRHDGAPSAPFADELEAMVGVRIGHHYTDYDFPTGNGGYVGVAYKELFGTRFVGLTLGYSIDMATKQHQAGHGERNW